MTESGTELISIRPKKNTVWYRNPVFDKKLTSETKMVAMWWNNMVVCSLMRKYPTGRDHRLYPICMEGKIRYCSNPMIWSVMVRVWMLGSVML